jgi:GABA permease
MTKTTAKKPVVELSKTLKSRHVSMIAIGGIIGGGLFIGASTTINMAGPAAAVSYMIAGTIILFVMRMLSEMAAATPGVQTFPEFARIGLGHMAGFLSGWLYWYFWVVVVAFEAVAGGKIINEWFPQFPVWEIGVALMALLTAVNLMSAKSYGEFEFWFSSIKVAAIIVFIGLAAAWASGFTSPNGPTFSNLVKHDGFMPNGLPAVLSATVSTIFALCGAEIATMAAAESKEPDRVIARMTLTVTTRILLFYVDKHRARQIALCNRARHDEAALCRCRDECDHPDCRALLPQLWALCYVAGAVRPRQARGCAAVAGAS